MKKKRLFYLDLVRVIAMFFIVTYHFAQKFSEQNIKIINLLSYPGLGTIGVALFFIISGASLMYNYGEKLDLKNYYKKRFLGIFPIFWIAYSLSFLYNFFECKGFFNTYPIYKLGLTFIGMDGYLNIYTDTWYLLGEWFLGSIIIIYLIFPLLRKLIKKYPKILFFSMSILYLLVVFVSKFKMPVSQNIVVCTFIFLLGMYWIEYVKDYKIWYIPVSVIVAVIFSIINISKDTYFTFKLDIIACAIFIVLVYIGNNINIKFLKNIVQELGKYSYPVFLVHHRIILRIWNYLKLAIFDVYGIICVYIIVWIVILVFSKLIYELNRKIIKIVTADEKN